jgi:hypothetical protein
MGRYEKLIHPDGTPFSEEERKERARKYQRAYYHSKKLKGRNQKKATIFPKKEVVKESCNRILKGAGFKNSEQVKDAIECVMDRERLERQRIKLKRIRRMIWGR